MHFFEMLGQSRYWRVCEVHFAWRMLLELLVAFPVLTQRARV